MTVSKVLCLLLEISFILAWRSAGAQWTKLVPKLASEISFGGNANFWIGQCQQKKNQNFLSHIMYWQIDFNILHWGALWKWWLGPQYFVLSKNTFLKRFSSQCGDACWSRTTDTYDLCSHMMLGQVCPRMECLECHWIKIIPRSTKQTDWRLVSDEFWESTRKMSFIWAIGFCKKWATFISIF